MGILLWSSSGDSERRWVLGKMSAVACDVALHGAVDPADRISLLSSTTSMFDRVRVGGLEATRDYGLLTASICQVQQTG